MKKPGFQKTAASNHKINGVHFSSFFDPGQVICQTDTEDRNAVIREMLELLARQHGIAEWEKACQELVEQEERYPALLGCQIAVPHVRLESIDTVLAGVVTSQKGIVYAQGAEPVKLLILMLVPKAAPGAYLQALSALSKACQAPEVAERISALKSGEEVWRFFYQQGMILPDHVCACDIMDPVKVKLQEHDTLEKAIDLFVRHGVEELPVVDKDEDLIGIVSAHELLRVCLPDYILWMDDVSTILNFEPFAELLRKENKTWLAEIMASEYVTVGEQAPAIQVAKELARSRANHAYIVRGQTLVGVVDLERFLSRILRE